MGLSYTKFDTLLKFDSAISFSEKITSTGKFQLNLKNSRTGFRSFLYISDADVKHKIVQAKNDLAIDYIWRHDLAEIIEKKPRERKRYKPSYKKAVTV